MQKRIYFIQRFPQSTPATRVDKKTNIISICTSFSDALLILNDYRLLKYSLFLADVNDRKFRVA